MIDLFSTFMLVAASLIVLVVMLAMVGLLITILIWIIRG